MTATKASKSNWTAAPATSPLLALDTRPNYIDTIPIPATSAKWRYLAIYSNDAQRIGQ